jgi:hypothetical protein
MVSAAPRLSRPQRRKVQARMQKMGFSRREARRGIWGNDRREMLEDGKALSRGGSQNASIAKNAGRRRHRRAQSVHAAIAAAEASY